MRRVDVVAREIDPATYKLRAATEADYATVIEGSTALYENGELKVVYLELTEALTELRAAIAAAPYGVHARTSGLRTRSAVFGWQPRNPLFHNYCGPTAWAMGHARSHSVVVGHASLVARYYQREHPVRYAEHLADAEQRVLPAWRLGSSPFTSGIANKNAPLGYHYDTGNFKGVWSAMLTLKQHIAGGYLVLPAYNLALAVRDRSLLLFDGQGILHGVSPIQMLRPNAVRYTAVYYSLEAMWRCLPPGEELARVREKRTELDDRRGGEANVRIPNTNKATLKNAIHVLQRPAGPRVAVWRYGLPLQLEGQSTVGGGFLARAMLDALVALGARVTVVGTVAKDLRGVLPWECASECKDLAGFDAVLLFPGPFNVMYGKDVFASYERLRTFHGKVLYAQWDSALPFHFHPEHTKAFRAACDVTHADLVHEKAWHLLTQVQETSLRDTKNSSTGYASAPFRVQPCFFELAEFGKPPLAPRVPTQDVVGYFGSDRPGRLAELSRFFGAVGAPPVHIFGRWSPASKAKLSQSNVTFFDPVPEESVAARLNEYLATIYCADPGYIRSDFVAQRVFENVTAGVPTFYSDKLQPALRAVLEDAPDLVVRSAGELSAALVRLRAASLSERVAYVGRNRLLARVVATARPWTIEKALREVLGCTL